MLLDTRVLIDTSDIVQDIVDNCYHEKILDIIKEIDLQVADWEFTGSVYLYFKDQLETGLWKSDEDKGE